jgi:hypothetical protein
MPARKSSTTSKKSAQHLDILLNKINLNPDDTIFPEAIAKTNDKDTLQKLLAIHNLSPNNSDIHLGALYNSSLDSRLTTIISSILSGKISTHTLMKLTESAQKEGDKVIETEYKSKLKTIINRQPNQREIIKNILNAYLHLSTNVIKVALVGGALLFFGNMALERYYDSQRRELVMPYYTQLYNNNNIKESKTLDSFLSVSHNAIPQYEYSILPSSPEAYQNYLSAIGLQESGDVTEDKRILLDNKIAMFQNIIDTYPGTAEAYKSQFQIYLLKSFNQDTYTNEEITGSLTTLLLNYPNVEYFTTKQLVEFMTDYLTLEQKSMDNVEAATGTTNWVETIIAQAQGTYLEAKLDYILASIYSGQPFVLTEVTGDEPAIVQLPNQFVLVGKKPFEDLFTASRKGNNLRAAIADYTLAKVLIDSDSRNLEDNSVYDETTDWKRIANLLQESILLGQSTENIRRSWTVDAYRDLSAILAHYEFYNDAINYLNLLQTNFPSDTYVTSGDLDKRKETLQGYIESQSQNETEKFNKGFDDWYLQLDQEFNASK